MQAPIIPIDIGIYIWRFLDILTPLSGHIISVGGQTPGISGCDIDPGYEGWFEQQGSSHQQDLRIELYQAGSPEDMEEAVQEILGNENHYGTDLIVPNWTRTWSIPSGASIYTVTSVSWQGGTGISRVEVERKFSVLFLQNGSLVSPRWFRAPTITATSNMFGFPDAEDFSLVAGTFAVLTAVGPNDEGYPQSSTWEATTT